MPDGLAAPVAVEGEAGALLLLLPCAEETGGRPLFSTGRDDDDDEVVVALPLLFVAPFVLFELDWEPQPETTSAAPQVRAKINVRILCLIPDYP